MGSDVQHQHQPELAMPVVAQPDVEATPASRIAFAAPVSGIARVVAAGAELMAALELAPAEPAPVVVGRADDPAEAEADRVATQVVAAMRDGGASAGGPSSGGGLADGVHRRASDPDDPLGGTAVGGGLRETLDRRRGGGISLPGGLADSLGEAFGGADFSGVRVHLDGEADAVARSLQATAFTHGSDIYFSKGTFDPASPSGQHLLAHELTHVVQNGGTAVQRKMWTAKTFRTETYENWYTGSSTTQKVLGQMLEDYATTFEKRGVVNPADAPRALARVREMSQSADWWIRDHQVVDTTSGMVQEDPMRSKRMAGFVAFKRHLQTETEQLESMAAKATTGGPAPAVDAPSPGFLKLQQKYEGDAKTFFEKLGTVAEQAVSDNGDATELEAAIKFPVDPSGVGFIGGTFTAAISKDDDLITMRSTLAITGGADVSVAEVSAELGGYIEAQSKSGADCMSLVSYSLYRRFRESHALPREAANYCWGGRTGDYGQKKAEQWSLDVENKMFGLEPMPVLGDFLKKYKDKAQASAAFEAEKARVEKKNAAAEATYVETGGTLGVGVSGDVGVASLEAAVTGSEGRRVDLTSLTNRKGGAGQANKASDNALAGVAQSLSGGTRGAQKRTGRSVRSLMVMAGVSGGAPLIGQVKGAATLLMKWANDGVSKRSGQASTTSLDSATLELAGEVSLPLGELSGDVAGPWVDLLQGKINDFVSEKARPAAEKKSEEDADGGDDPEFAGLDALLELNSTALSDVKEQLNDELLELAQSSSGGGDSYKMSVLFDMKAKSIAFELRNQSEKSIELPKALTVSKKSSSRMFRFIYKGGAWTRG